jgi:ABC-type phosphate transport system permease subunit
MLWLCGGALAICLMMIAGLIAMVLWFGLGTFWPGPLVQVKLHDGTTLLGEVTRAERYDISAQAIDNLDADLAGTLRARADEEGRVRSTRRLLRTENYELTNRHFHWVSDFEEIPGSTTEPEWAILIERIKSGRFYGEPTSFVLEQVRSEPAEERQLRQIVQFFQANRFRLNENEQNELDRALPAIEQQLAELRGKNAADFLASFAANDGRRIEAVVDGGQTVTLAEVKSDEHTVTAIREIWEGASDAWAQLQKHHAPVRLRDRERVELEKHDLGNANRKLEDARLAVRQAELDHQFAILPAARDLRQLRDEMLALESAKVDVQGTAEDIRQQLNAASPLAKLAENIAAQVLADIDQQIAAPAQASDEIWADIDQLEPAARQSIEVFLSATATANKEAAKIQQEIDSIKDDNARYQLSMTTSTEQSKMLPLAEIVRAVPANQLSTGARLKTYLSRWYEFLVAEPREANSEGGVMPAIWGTVAMTMIMSLIVVPFGVLAALYLREYAKGGAVVSAVRISINNLAGVPSIVFGVFGLGFFCYIIGGFVDGGAQIQMPPARWWLLLIALTIFAIGAFSLSLQSLTRVGRSASSRGRFLGAIAGILWLLATLAFIVVVASTPYFSGFFAATLPNPTFGKGGLLWASLTLALLTLPVVIVATEEALSAVPNSLREGSYACGGSKWQTIRRIVLPHAMPGIMTGMILAMARGAGEVAPLMLVGAVKMAPELPVDASFPFVHAERSFMHLGFHIYDLGFQSQNSEAAKPMVFTTTLLLILIIAVMNLLAIMLRARLKRRFKGAEF